ncbi:MAG: glycoside hydrolase family 32 protein [Anaerolineae bacterium]
MKTFDFETYADVRRTMAQDIHHPTYHFLPPANWMNDPNGLIQWGGRYHLFYQHNPDAPIWGNIHWGHAVSDDLTHWRDLPLALAPTPGSCDADGCWSGCAVDDAGTPTLVYTGRRDDHETVCLARGGPELVHWTRDPRNPVISGPPAGLKTAGFRDPFVWQADGRWWMLLGSGIEGRGGAVLLYRSADLIEWTYLGPLFVSDGVVPDTMWECPNFFRLNERWVLLVSVLGGTGVRAFSGDFDGRRFTPTRRQWIDHGEVFFAPLTFADEAGRRLLFGWLQEARSPAAQRAAGWSGLVTLPRVLSLTPDGMVSSEPAPEVEALRGEVLDLDAPLPLACELRLSYKVHDTVVGFALSSAEDGGPAARIGYDPQAQRLFFAGTGCAPKVGVQRARSPCSVGARLELRVFVDHSAVEIFANGGVVLSGRMYPAAERLRFTSLGGEALSVEAWTLQGIW